LPRTIPLAALLLALVAPPVPAAERSYAADLAYELGARALRQRDPATAVEKLGRAVELAPLDPAAHSLYARALLLAGRPAEAADILQRLRELDPAAPDLDMMLGLALLRMAEWNGARDHFEAARQADPRNGRVHLFLGVAEQELGEPEAADRAFDEAGVLDPTLKPRVAYRRALVALRTTTDEAEARRLLEDVLTEVPGSLLADSAAMHLRRLELGETRRWEVRGSIGFAYDTNVNLAGQDDFFPTSGETDYRGEFELGLEGLVLDRQGLRFRIGYQGDLSAHRSEKDLDIEANELWALASYDLTRRVGLELRYGLGWAWADWESYRRTHAIEPTLRVFEREDLFTRFFYRLEDRGFFLEDGGVRQLDRDGQVRTMGVEQYWILPNLRGWGTGFARVSLRYRTEDTQGDNFDSHGGIGVATLGVALPWDTFLVAEGWLEKRRFDHQSLFAPTRGDRRDRITQVRLGLRRPVGEHFSVSGGWRYIHWDSNVALYDFDRHVTDLRLTYRY
jgi:Flp pilus assembly protein TadD